MNTNKLYLLPSSMGETDIDRVVPGFNKNVILNARHFACENTKTARRFLIRCGMPSPIPEDVHFIEIRNDEDKEGLKEAYAILNNNKDLIYLSEAGNPCIADPGEALVLKAHTADIPVVPLVGASSILLALIASGFSGEQFTFHGYIPREKDGRIKTIKHFLQQAKNGYTQLFMDTPYRNNQVLEDILNAATDDTEIAIAVNICCENEHIIRKTVRDLKQQKPNINKQPCIFVFGC